MTKVMIINGSPRNIRDPWYTGNFDESYWDIYEGCQAFLKYLKENFPKAYYFYSKNNKLDI